MPFVLDYSVPGASSGQQFQRGELSADDVMQLWSGVPDSTRLAFTKAAIAHSLPLAYLVTTAACESRFKGGSRGAERNGTTSHGMFQLNDLAVADARRKNPSFDPYDVAQAAEFAASLLSKALRTFGAPEYAFWSYVSGPRGVKTSPSDRHKVPNTALHRAKLTKALMGLV